jgi:hypothetical protein
VKIEAESEEETGSISNFADHSNRLGDYADPVSFSIPLFSDDHADREKQSPIVKEVNMHHKNVTHGNDSEQFHSIGNVGFPRKY